MRAVASKPKVFIGSSKQGLRMAECLRVGLKDQLEATLWTEGVFQPSNYTFEDLERVKDGHDYAVFVCTADDLRCKNNHWGMSPRDNVLLEWSYFAGAMGRQRSILVCEVSAEMPTDTNGVTVVRFEKRQDGNDMAAMGPASLEIKRHIEAKANGTPAEVPVVAERSVRPMTAGRATRAQVERRRRRRSLGCAAMSREFKIHQIVNISVTGALLETDGELPVGQLLDLKLELDDASTAEVQARIVRVQRPDWMRVGGVGVAFTEYRGDALGTIERYVSLDPAAR